MSLKRHSVTRRESAVRSGPRPVSHHEAISVAAISYTTLNGELPPVGQPWSFPHVVLRDSHREWQGGNRPEALPQGFRRGRVEHAFIWIFA